MRKHSLATRKLISLNQIGNKRPHLTGKGNPANRLEVRKKISESKKGVKNPNWKGGVSTANNLLRHSLEYKLWREAVFKRDNYSCIWCGAKNGDGVAVVLNADHIKPFAFYPELRFAIDNGRTLCKSCHESTETYGFKKQICESTI